MSVESLTAAAQAYAAATVSAADATLATAVAKIQEVGFIGLAFDPQNAPTPPTLDDPLVPPTLADVALELPSEPTTELLFQDITAIETGTVPEFTIEAPTLNLPPAPTALAAFQGTLPTITTDFAFPEPPAQLLNPLLTEPTITDRAAPAKPTVILPAFEAVLPDGVPEAPTDLRAEFENTYAGQAPAAIAMLDGYVDEMLAKFCPRFATGMAALENQLQRFLDGGTGFNADVENQIYERSRGRQDAEARRTADTARADAASRGHTMPDGAVNAAIRRARQGAADNNAAATREIVIKQQEIEQGNLQFAVTTMGNLRTSMLQSALSYHQNLVTINGQAIDYAKFVVNSITELFNTAVKLYEVRLEGYKAEASVYETKLKAALSQIELYRAEIEALRALGEVDSLRVSVYRARIDALQGLTAVYRGQIEAVQGRASLEKLKLEVFGGEVQAYTAGVQAKNAEIDVFKARMQGEEAGVHLFDSLVRAHGERVTTFKTVIEAKSEAVRAQAITNQARSENFRAVWSAYQNRVQAIGEVARTKLENNRQTVVAFQAAAQAQVANAQVRADYYRATGDITVKNAQLSIEAIVKSADIRQQFAATIAGLYNANAQVHSALASSAMAGMNTLAAESITS